VSSDTPCLAPRHEILSEWSADSPPGRRCPVRNSISSARTRNAARSAAGVNPQWGGVRPGASVSQSFASVQGKAPQRRAATGLPSWVRPTEWTEVGTSRTSCTRS
jgi:hypothetical protein